jgi:hypothetical protein
MSLVFLKYLEHSSTHYTGNLYRHGDSPAESNHASFVIRIGKQSSVEPAEAIKNMLDRQIDLVKERSGRVAKYVLHVLAVGRTLTSQQDKLALNWLCKEGYELWKSTSKWPEYKIAKCASNPEERLVSHPATDKAPYLICVTCVEGTTCISEFGRCNCQERTAYLHQCKHERAVLNGRFDSNLWQKRWSRRSDIVMSDGNPVIAAISVIGGANTNIDTLTATGTVCIIGQPKEDKDESGMFPEGDDDYSTFADATVDQRRITEVAKLPTKLSFKSKMELFIEAGKAFEGHEDEMEFYGALIAQTRLLKGKGDTTIGSLEYLSNYLSGYTSCRTKDVLFSQMVLSQTETNDATPTTVPLAPGLIPFAKLPTSATGAPQQKRLRSHQEQRNLINSKKHKAACSFCCLPGHTVAKCDQLKQFVGKATEILVDDKKDFAWSLVKETAARRYQVDPNNDNLIWQNGGLPNDTHHVVVLAMLEGYNQGTNDNMGGTGLLVKLLSSTAQNCEGNTGPTVYRSMAVSDWILSKGRAKPKRLFSSLQSCHS